MHTLAALTWGQFAEDAYKILLPVLTVLAGLVAAWLSQKYGSKLDADTRGSLQRQLQQHALDAVATVYQRTVKDLKDPNKPGEFTASAQLEAQEAARLLLTLSAGPILTALANGGTGESVVDQAIERAVVELGTRTPAGTDQKPATPPQSVAVVTVVEAAQPTQGTPSTIHGPAMFASGPVAPSSPEPK